MAMPSAEYSGPTHEKRKNVVIINRLDGFKTLILSKKIINAFGQKH
jgi:hypothetical protein